MRSKWIRVASLLFMTMLLIAGSDSGIAKINFKGRGGLNSRKAISSAYHRLPERVRKVTVNLVQYSGDEWEIAKLLGGPIIGLYYSGDKTIYLLRDSGELWRFVFLHEMGHHYWFNGMTDDEKTAWTIYWLTHLEDMPRDYARTNPVEGWAETFAVTYSKKFIPKWIHHPSKETIQEVITLTH